ncbi:MAG: DUF4838 domain-containing protein [Sphingobacteriia bacterium]|nr:DUF4838 domain-containing protein [Sphingobacteriia bacterium]
MKKFLLLPAVILFSVSCFRQTAETITLVSNGQSNYSIVIPDQSSVEERRAATFLQDHLKKISGCLLPILSQKQQSDQLFILIEKSDEIESGDAFSISTLQRNILIKGGDKKGCIYGVVELLEKFLGVRYYSPEYVIIPEKEDILLPEINMKCSSPNTYRNVHGKFANDSNYRDFHRLHVISDSFAEGYYVHTFQRLIPWQNYFSDHPEYFAFMNGKRIKDQLCLSNPEVLRLVIEKLEKEMALQPDKKIWSVSQNDNFSYCQCERCSKIISEEGSPSGPVIRFVNQVAEHFPDKIISTLAYQYSRKAPRITKPNDNVQVMLCTIELNRSIPIAEDPASISFLTDISDWQKITKRIYLWDYTVNFAHNISPFPNLHTLQPNIQLFADYGVKEHFQQSNTSIGHEFSELKSYLLAKILWNPQADFKGIFEEFIRGFYGRAAPYIFEYILHLEKEIRKTGEWLDIYGPPTNYQNTFLSEKNISAYNQYFDEAEKAVSEDSAHLMHVRIARMPVQYAMMEIGKADMFGPRGWYFQKGEEYIPRPYMIDQLEAFNQTAKICHVESINESGLTAAMYYEATKRFINVQVEGNLAFKKIVTANPLPAKKYSEGNISLLTNGVRGSNDYKVHWLGWEAENFSLILDLEQETENALIEISTLWDPKSWILHPASVTCSVSDDGSKYLLLEKQIITGDQQQEEVSRLFTFQTTDNKFRYLKFEINGTLSLPHWHPSAGGGSWVFVDEIVVKQ